MPDTSGLETLRQIAKENREAEERATAAGPVACPIDGTPLETHPVSGVRNCPMGNFRYEG